ncbi:MAG: ATP-binding protein [Lachnospiraceae bacterium]|nr:ATP-binding protein [Lachnospiraceae bacterium]
MVGRRIEQERLLDYYASGKSELVAVYGRRRVGKTYLIRETFGDGFFFSYTGSAQIASTAGHLERFSVALGAYGLDGGGEAPPKTWMEAFDRLRNAIETAGGNHRKVIFVDEMPWLDRRGSGFLAAFDYFWNAFASARRDILFIVCGSATSWITKKLFQSRGGLHNRVTGRIYLRPFTLQECEAFLAAKGSGYARYDLIECYMVFGGIPYYLDFIEKKYSLAVNIDHMVFAEGAPLANEFEELYASLFEHHERYTEVVAALASKMKGLTREEIVAQTSHENGGNLTSILADLELSGFVRRYDAYPHKKNGSIYQLIDHFSLFWFAFLHDRRPTSPRYWSMMRSTPRLNAWRGYAFEIVCLRHIDQIEQGLGISGVITYVSAWRSRKSDPGAQIDLVIERGDRVCNLCELKYAQAEYEITKEYAENLRRKEAAFLAETKTRRTLFTTMVTTYGVKRNMHSGIVRAEVAMDALFLPPIA